METAARIHNLRASTLQAHEQGAYTIVALFASRAAYKNFGKVCRHSFNLCEKVTYTLKTIRYTIRRNKRRKALLHNIEKQTEKGAASQYRETNGERRCFTI